MGQGINPCPIAHSRTRKAAKRYEHLTGSIRKSLVAGSSLGFVFSDELFLYVGRSLLIAIELNGVAARSARNAAQIFRVAHDLGIRHAHHNDRLASIV